MERIEFDTHLGSEGIIPIPEEVRKELSKIDWVHVTITSTAPKRMDRMQRLWDNPIIAPDFKMPSKQEMYDHLTS
ncbi:MAG TPA: hypothetical protein VGM92_07235 [Candidatus Kapabacteria bacterium]